MSPKLNIVLAVLQGLLFLDCSSSLPLESDVSPCDLFVGEDDTDNTLFCDQKDTTLEQIKNALNTLKGQGTIELELYQVNLGTIPSNFFKGHNIKVLTIAFCDLVSLTGGNGRPLEGLEDTLEVLMIKGSSIDGSEFENSALSHLRKLKQVEFHGNHFPEISNDWFKNAPPSLHAVILSDNNIQKLGNRVFADIVNLDVLDVNGNSFGYFSRSMLPIPANNLWRLELDDNKLSSIPEDMFSNMPKLERVSLASNYISKVPEKTWRPIWKQLTHVDLSDNPLECGDNHMKWINEEPGWGHVTGDCLP